MGSYTFFTICLLHSTLALICGALMMFYTQEISAFTHGRVTASRLIGSTPHDQLLIQISDSFSGLLLFAIGLLLLMVAFVKDREFHGFFAKGCVAHHVMERKEASAIPFVALTAWRALKSTAKITEGQRVLILGGGGAVGFSAVQIAVGAGCYVATTCGVENIDRVLAAGAEQAIDYTSDDIETLIKGKFDAVLDTIGVPDTETLGTNFLFKGGRYMTLQGESVSYADSYGLILGLPLATAVLAKKQLQYQMSHGINYSWVYMRADPEGLQEIRRLCDAGKFNIPVEKTYPITQVREAREAKDNIIIIGKVVLEVD